MANVLVTGGAGYVGSVCCAELLRGGHSVTIVDDLSTGSREAVPSGAAFFQIDIGNQSTMQSLVSHIRFDAVFHFAAKALIPESVSNPGMFFQHNVASGIVILEVLRAAGIRNFVFSSSAAVYGTPERVPIDEDDPKQPVNSYGETKLMFERILEWYSRAYGWSVTALRYSTLPARRRNWENATILKRTSFRCCFRRPRGNARSLTFMAMNMTRPTEPACATTCMCWTLPARTFVPCKI